MYANLNQFNYNSKYFTFFIEILLKYFALSIMETAQLHSPPCSFASEGTEVSRDADRVTK